MKAAQLTGPKTIEIGDVPQPAADDKKVLLKIERCGICGSDLHIWENGMPEGLIMGHEFAGVIEDLGGDVPGLEKGMRVTALPSNPCGTCEACKKMEYNRCLNMLADAPGITTPGAYTGYMVINRECVCPLPEGMSFDQGAMVEPSAVAMHAVNLAGINPGDTVLVVGGGIIGQLTAAWARISGAAYIAMCELNQGRANKALGYGDVDEVFDAARPDLQKALLTRTSGGFTKVIECAGPAPAVKTAVGATRQGATVVLAGISYAPVPVSTMRVAMRELTLKGSYGYTQEEFLQTVDYIGRGVLRTDRFIDEFIELDQMQQAFEKLVDPNSDAVKIMVRL